MAAETDTTYETTFWSGENGYKNVLQRIECGYKNFLELEKFIQERAEIEKVYSTSLNKWAKKWEPIIATSSEYGTGFHCWFRFIDECNQLSDIHGEMHDELMDKIVVMVRNWSKENYPKTRGNSVLKDAKVYELEFSKLEKEWMRYYQIMEDARKKYYQSHRALLDFNARVFKEEINEGEVAEKRNEPKRTRLEADIRKAKAQYESGLTELELQRQKFMKGMTEHFEKCQEFERDRMRFFHTILKNYKKAVDITKGSRLANLYISLNESLASRNVEEDLKYWSKMYGTDSPITWPRFEEFDKDKHELPRLSMMRSRKSLMQMETQE